VEEEENKVCFVLNLLSLLLTNYSCLAHVINLATQMLISTYSKSPHFDPKEPDAHIPTSRDEVGMVRAIVVKVCTIPCEFSQLLTTAVQERSSSKRKEMWKTIQTKMGHGRAIQLILDMKVRWSSTYLMLDRTEKKKEVCIKFKNRDARASI
jgi:hypothetical protein